MHFCLKFSRLPGGKGKPSSSEGQLTSVEFSIQHLHNTSKLAAFTGNHGEKRVYSKCTWVAADCPRISSSCRRATMSRPTALPVILPAVLAIFTMSLGSEQRAKTPCSDRNITSKRKKKTCRSRPTREPSPHRPPQIDSRAGNRGAVARRGGWVTHSS